MRWNKQHLGAGMILVISGVAFGLISCGTSSQEAPRPRLVILGDAIESNPSTMEGYAFNFGRVEQGRQTVSEFTLANSGTARLRVEVANAEELPGWLSLAFDPIDLDPKEEMRVGFAILPNEKGPFEATIAFRTNEQKGLRTLRVYGEAIPWLELRGDAIQADPGAKADYALDFGMVAIGGPITLEVIAVNTGSAPLRAEVQGAEVLPLWLSLGFGRLDLVPNETQRLEFSVDPREIGPFEATVTLKADEENRVWTIRLHGEAIRPNLKCDSKVDFGDVPPGEIRDADATCTNLSEAPVTVAIGDFVGAYRKYFTAEFRAGDLQTARIPAGGSADILVSFSYPGRIGPVTTTLPIKDAHGAVLSTLRVDANGVEHALQVRYEKEGERIPLVGCFSFPDARVGEVAIQSLYVRNLSSDYIHIESFSLHDDETDWFRIVSPRLDGPLPIGPNGEEEVEVQISLRRESESLYENELIIRSDDPFEPADGGIRVCLEG